MKKLLSLAIVLVMIFALAIPAMAAAPAAVDGDSAKVTARVEKLSGNQNRLWITITPVTGAPIQQDFLIKNNAADTYTIGGYKVYVDTYGNVKIRECYFVRTPFSRYLRDVARWNAIYLDPATSEGDKQILRDMGGLAHYYALKDYYGTSNLAPGTAFDAAAGDDIYEYWANQLEAGLAKVDK